MCVNLLINDLPAKLCKHRDFGRKFFGNNVRANDTLPKVNHEYYRFNNAICITKAINI